MDTSRLVYGSLLIQLLIIVQGIHLSCAREIDSKQSTDVLRLHSMDHEIEDPQVEEELHTHSDSASSHMMMMMHHNMDPSTIVFFQLEDLKLGQKIPIFFPDRDLPSPSSPSSLPKSVADSIPFSLKHLPYLLQRFSFSKGSPQAIAMENTLRECETDPIQGETKLCATSYESMLDFATKILDSENEIKLLSTVYLTKPNNGVQEYTIIEDPFPIQAQKMVACHTMPYPYTVFYCHYQRSESRVFKVSLNGDEEGNNNRVEALAVCHMDTSQWNPNHISFQVLRTKPGESPVCHFFPADNFVLVSVPSASSI
ncbi:OLC1v1003179C1 [Oldenlandia corymbosa var. corymbosa]|uniref:OLC1v1003179C1 n=1 Tax=Oldenlandia corymbosa var. corymbosa TaxID=529605 RepID=A0AAV1D9G2_OLDCO|nr:OLC1v1003179C1 [Oldenlandia corymbosa var. corymbosa]